LELALTIKGVILSIYTFPKMESSGTEEPKNSGASLLKTPVSLLQELYVRKGITPTYDLMQV